ncbi:MAG: GH92 family glycosyl hydrolase [Saprospiraceae bacterium]|nr:GH92 family glycosyl hydrolase [Candidatus Vicinibacter affinis]MBK7797801.1 GH92 family glycosyl hydrolase [Candidatus Vicinibacter affinis]MBK8402735.1 GH92 family glycosyl hydrolase [Candidatus Vicinibacter affinis]MBP6172010.1 GH92 family glycosyl hydrolase [Saprospiraceae bacterium]MBP6522139.1 GH92 family glycosyl hydrolase [Saprospiraceae bacterium]
MNRLLFFLYLLFPIIIYSQYVEFVNPFVGTGGHGHTFPGATSPFGMVQLSPDTRLEGWDGCSGYHYSDSIIYGFSHTHLSGTGVADYCDVLIMPGSGKLQLTNGFLDSPESASAFNKKTEKALPGIYECFLTKPQIRVRLTVTPRTGIHEYVFQKENDSKWIKIDLKHRDKLIKGNFSTITENEITGTRISSSWAKEQHIYFKLKSSVAFKSKILSKDGTVLFCEFEKSTKRVVLQCAISAVDEEGAKTNLKSEWIGFNFEKAYKSTKNSWNKMLGRIDVTSKIYEGKQKEIFYTSLYHLLIQPNIFQDADNRYRGMDNKIHFGDPEYPRYTVFSLWDTYRAAHPFYQLVYPDYNEKFVLSFLGQFDECGRLPVWELAGNETYCMIGNHSIPVLTNALLDQNSRISKYRQRIERAIRETLVQDFSCLQNFRNGFISSDECSESVSKTIENSVDFGALKLVSPSDERIVENTFYKNLFNPKTGFFQAKLNHTFVEPFDPTEVNFHFTEANAWQYLFGAHHDVAGMIDCFSKIKFNGEANYLSKHPLEIMLDSLFQSDSKMTGRAQSDITGLLGQYAHGNEPSHHIAYLYNYCNRTDKAQQIVRRILRTMYANEPDGLCGNEDCGQMSAWYLWSSLGFYPVNPLLNSYDLGCFVFDKASIRVPGEREINLVSNKKEGSKFVQKVTKNGFSQNSLIDLNPGDHIEFIYHDDNYIQLDLSQNNKSHDLNEVLPFVVGGERTFQDSTRIELSSLSDFNIEYKLGDLHAISKYYTNPIIIHDNESIYFRQQKNDSNNFNLPWLTARFSKRPSGFKIQSISEYAPMYSAGGKDALIDGLEGSLDFRDGFWQGYFGKDLNVEFSLSEEAKADSLEVRFLQDQNSWILLPSCVIVFTSIDGVNFNREAEVVNKINQKSDSAFAKKFSFKIENSNARFIKLAATNPGKLPDWHLSAGESSWIFADEIKIIKK